MKTGTEHVSPFLKREEWMYDKKRFYQRKTESIRAKTEPNIPMSSIWGLWYHYLFSTGLGLPWPVNSAAFGTRGLLQITHSVPAALLRKCPMFPAFPISWGLHWLLSITFIAWHTVHSGAPSRDFWSEQETDTTSQSVLRYRTQKVTKRIALAKSWQWSCPCWQYCPCWRLEMPEGLMKKILVSSLTSEAGSSFSLCPSLYTSCLNVISQAMTQPLRYLNNSWLGQLDRPVYLPCCVWPISALSPIEIL